MNHKAAIALRSATVSCLSLHWLISSQIYVSVKDEICTSAEAAACTGMAEMQRCALICKLQRHCLLFCADDSSPGKDGARPAGDTEFSTDLSGKLGKVLELSDPPFELLLVLLAVIAFQDQEGILFYLPKSFISSSFGLIVVCHDLRLSISFQL